MSTMYPALLNPDNFQVAAAVFWQLDAILFFYPLDILTFTQGHLKFSVVFNSKYSLKIYRFFWY